MIKAHKVWWNELADQYEEWSDNPPKTLVNTEQYTCIALISDGKFGWRNDSSACPTIDLKKIWINEYGNVFVPAGHIYREERDARRYEFCLYMAETIRKAIG